MSLDLTTGPVKNIAMSLLPIDMKRKFNMSLQPNPAKNDKPEVYKLFTKDLEDRYRIGLERYGVALQPFNGRDALQDAYEEAIDLAFYLRQALYERDGK